MYGRAEPYLHEIRQRLSEYWIFDISKRWPPFARQHRFNNISAFGIFGISPNEAMYERCFQNAAKALAQGATFVGADWVRSQSLIEYEGHDNRYMDLTFVRGILERAAFSNIEAGEVVIEGDELYNKLVFWAGKAP